MFDRDEPSEANGYQCLSAALILSSYRALIGRDLLLETKRPEGNGLSAALYHAPFAVVAHDTQDDPVFFYANLTAQKLFALSWEKFVSLPSRYSAEAPNREERAVLLKRVTRDGFIDDYRGVRIASSGQRFIIEGATVWNLVDGEGVRCGQAATFDRWQFMGDG